MVVDGDCWGKKKDKEGVYRPALATGGTGAGLSSVMTGMKGTTRERTDTAGLNVRVGMH